jgi:acyl-CoA synthetase (AMP-forming)/AMP-acid ligase II
MKPKAADSSQLSSVNVGDILSEHARSRPMATAVVQAGIRATYRELDSRVGQATGALANLGVGQSSTVLWLGKNSTCILELIGACARLGAVFIPVNWRQSAAELAFVIDDVSPAVIVWQDKEMASRSARDLTQQGACWVQADAEGPGSYEQLLADAEPRCADLPWIDPTLPLLGVYTAAFEGRPNAALLSHTAVLTEALIVGRIAELSDASIYLNSGPMFHLGTLMTSLSILVHGGTNVVIPGSDAQEICENIERERCDRAFIMQPTLEAIRVVNADNQWDLTSLWPSCDPHTWSTCTPSLNPQTARSGGYGQTELSGLVTSSGLGTQAQGTHGRPVPLSQVRIVDAEGVDVGPGEVGEIVCRGPMVMAGYLNRADVTAAHQRLGWYHTGDLARREHDGSITFVGPVVRMIKSAAENIYPVEVEMCLRSHAAVADVCVIGVPDQVWTQAVKALVVLGPGCQATKDELIEHCRERIASYKKPRSIVFVTEVPRRGDGSIDRDRADVEHGGGGYPGS